MNKFGGKWGGIKRLAHLILQTESLELMATARPSRKRGKRPNAREYCGDIKDPQGFEVRSVDDYIGEGVFTTQTFCRGDFLLEYKGDLINYEEAQRREKEYAEADLGSFLYFFKYKGKHLCVDGTEDIFYQGRMINDAPKGDKLQNCAMKIVVVDNKPHLCAFATRDIVIGEELRYDYGVPDLPWRRETIQKATARRRNRSPDSLLGQKNGNIRDENVNKEKIPENPYIGDRNADSADCTFESEVTDTTESSFRDTNTADLREKEYSSDRHTENGGGRITENADPASMDTNVENIKTNGTKSDRNADSADCTFEKGVTDTTESIFRDTNTTDLREKEYSSDRHTENGGGRITENADPASMDTDVENITTNGDISDRNADSADCTFESGVTDTTESSFRDTNTADLREKEYSSDRHTENGGGRITENADPASMDTDVEYIKTNGDISDRNADSADCTFESGVTDTTESSFWDTNTADLREKEYSIDRHTENGGGRITENADPASMDTDVEYIKTNGDISDRNVDNADCTFESGVTDTTESSFRDTNTAELREKEYSSDRHAENGGGRITENADPASMDTDVENITTNGDISDRNADSADCTFESGVTDTTESSFRDTNTADLREKEYSIDRHTENGGGRITENADPASMDTDVEYIKTNGDISDRNADSADCTFESGVTDTTESSFRDTNTADLREKEYSIDRHTENGGGRITENADPASMDTDVEYIKTNGDISDRNADSADCTFESGVTDTTESSFRDTNTADLREKEYSIDRHTENGGGRITENADPASMDTDVEYIKTNGDISDRNVDNADCTFESGVTDTTESSFRDTNTAELREKEYSSDRHAENGGGRITENADPASMDTDVENITTNGDIGDRNADSADCTFEKGVTDTTESSFRDTNTADLLEKEYSSDRHINNGEDTFEGRGTDPVPMDTEVKNAIMIGDSSDRHTDNGESTFEGKAIDPVSLDTEVENVKINGDSEYGGNKWPAHVRKRKIVAGEFTVNYDSSSEDFDDDFRDPSYQQPDSDSGCSTSGDSDDHTDVCDDSDDIALLYKEGMVNSGSISNQDTVTERMTSADHHNGKQYCNDRRNDNGNTGEDRINHRDERKLITFRKQMENVTLPLYSRKEDGKRDYRKINCCFYCERTFTSKISDHYLNVHVNEEEVRKIRLMEVGSSKRKTALMELENRGNFKYNVKTIEKGTGELIVARRPNAKNSERYTSYRFLPCEYCLGFYFEESLWLHQQTCKLRPLEEQPSTNCVRDARTMLAPFLQDITEEDESLENIFYGMKETKANPGIPKLCKNDKLIREFAKSLLHRLGENDEQRIKDMDNIRTKVRTVGRLLQELNTKHGIMTLSEYIRPNNFFNVVEGTKSLALKTESPQNALVLGHYIKQITLLKNSLGIVENSSNEQNEARDFQTLYQAHWNNRVSCVAKRRQRLRQMNKAAEIPITEDLVKLTRFLKEELKNCIKIQSPDDQTWKKTAQLTLVRIDLFNKRRISEIQELKVSDYLSAEKNDETDESILNALEMSDKILSQRMRVLEVKGKSVRGLRKVFVILAPDMINALEYLMRTRCSNSPFMFCRKTDKTPIDGCEAMRDVTKMCPGLKFPERIRSRKIRKYLATTCQLIDMTDSELKLVADHMGHNLNIHTDVYRLQSSLLEKTKVARVLIAMENGCIDKFEGRNVNDIPLDSIPEPITYDDAWAKTAQSEANTNETDVTDAEAGESVNSRVQIENHTEVGGDQEESEVIIYRRQQTVNDSDDDSDIGGRGSKRSKAPAHGVIKRVRWDEEENRLFREEMQPYINTKTMPPGQRINDLARVLKNRTKAQIRTKIHNIISGKLKTF